MTTIHSLSTCFNREAGCWANDTAGRTEALAVRAWLKLCGWDAHIEVSGGNELRVWVSDPQPGQYPNPGASIAYWSPDDHDEQGKFKPYWIDACVSDEDLKAILDEERRAFPS